MTLGSDLAGATDLHLDLRLSDGRRALAEALVRRYLTQRGALWYDGEYGLALTRFVASAAPTDSIGQLVERQALLDERVADARAEVSREDGAILITLTVTDADGPFSLTLRASEVGLEVLRGTP